MMNIRPSSAYINHNPVNNGACYKIGDTAILPWLYQQACWIKLKRGNLSKKTKTSNVDRDADSSLSRPYGSNSSALPILANGTGNSRRRDLYKMRTRQRPIVRGIADSIACCGTGRIPDPDLPEGFEKPVDLVVSEDDEGTRRAGVVGTTRCKSVWACPVCASRITAQREAAIAQQVEAHIGRGGTAHKLDLTLSHKRGDDLVRLLDGIGDAWGEVTSGGRWQKLRKKGIIKYIVGQDITWSPQSGWHPHLHVVVLADHRHGDGQEVADYIKKWFLIELWSLCLEAEPDLQVSEPCFDAVAAAKYAVRSAFVDDAKSLDRKRRLNGALSPFEILQNAIDEREERSGNTGPWQRLWCEYVAGTKGRRQLRVSRGISLEALETGKKPAPVAKLKGWALRDLDRRHLVPSLLDLSEQTTAAMLPQRLAIWFSRALPVGGWQVVGLERLSPDAGTWEIEQGIRETGDPDHVPDPDAELKDGGFLDCLVEPSGPSHEDLLKEAVSIVEGDLIRGGGTLSAIKSILSRERFSGLSSMDVLSRLSAA